VTRFVVAHLSDCHIGATDEAPARLRRALDHVAACAPQPDVVLLSGDLADHGLDVEYEVAARLLSTVTVPVIACPGNHDVRTRFVQHLGPAESVIDVAGYRLIVLNSLVDAPEGERIDRGELTEDSLRLLDEALAAGAPTFVGLHHPPVDLHVDLMDPIKLSTAEGLAEVLARHGNVVAVLVGTHTRWPPPPSPASRSWSAAGWSRRSRPTPRTCPGSTTPSRRRSPCTWSRTATWSRTGAWSDRQ
jgi:3',5'-cyclic-AMP phosphodiesterase